MDRAHVDRNGFEILDRATCVALLATHEIGRLAFAGTEGLLILPVTYAMDGETVVFRSAPGTKLGAAAHEDVVAFEVDDYDVAEHTGWSVVVRGPLRLVTDETALERLYGLSAVPWGSQEGQSLWLRIEPVEITGRRRI